jgi:serine phosphatase RsbU (regulator of sigma subunit)
VTAGDRIIALSDGLVEVRDRRGEPIGFERLVAVVQTGDPDTIFQRLLDCVPEPAGNLGYDDDISLVELVV